VPQLIGQGGDVPLQPQGRLQGPDDMIFLRQGSPKERHQTLARALGDRTRKAFNLFTHQGGGAPEQCVESLRLDRLGQCHHTA
jgi:hypothetical protein